MVNRQAYTRISEALLAKDITLVAVSKTKPAADIRELYDLGQRDFGENYVQELVDKYEVLPHDIQWHFIGHLQRNKIKYLAPFVHLIHGVDSYKLLLEINKEAAKLNRSIAVLLQVRIAREETKFGMEEAELNQLIDLVTAGALQNVVIRGLMGMASLTENDREVEQEFRNLKALFDKIAPRFPGGSFRILSMGMSGDYLLAVASGTNMVRIGSLIFGDRSSQPE